MAMDRPCDGFADVANRVANRSVQRSAEGRSSFDDIKVGRDRTELTSERLGEIGRFPAHGCLWNER